MRNIRVFGALGSCGAMVIGLLFALPALGQELGKEWTALTAKTADIVFQDPSLEDKIARRMRTSDDGYQYTFEIAVWTGPLSKNPKAQVHYLKLQPGYHFPTAPDPKDIARKFTYLANGDTDFAQVHSTRNRLGRVRSRRFQSTETDCVSFVQQFGVAQGSLFSSGTRRISGFYCADPGASLSDAKVDAVLGSIEIRE